MLWYIIIKLWQMLLSSVGNNISYSLNKKATSVMKLQVIYFRTWRPNVTSTWLFSEGITFLPFIIPRRLFYSFVF